MVHTMTPTEARRQELRQLSSELIEARLEYEARLAELEEAETAARDAREAMEATHEALCVADVGFARALRPPPEDNPLKTDDKPQQEKVDHP